MVMVEDWKEAKRRMLVLEAASYVGVRETGGANQGEFVRYFQSLIGKAEAEPWCMAFAQRNAWKVDYLAGGIASGLPRNCLYASEHCLTVWRQTPLRARRARPVPGLLVIFQHGTTESGHTGVVERVNPDGSFGTIEGNTNQVGSREGDGVYRKTRHLGADGELNLLGFLDPWG